MKGLIIAVFLVLIATPAWATTSKWMGGYVALNTGTVRYISPTGNFISTVENGAQGISSGTSGGTIQKFYAHISAAPGGGKSWAVVLRDEQSNSVISCTIADPATDCNSNSSLSIVAGRRLAISVTPSGTPAAANFSYIMEYVSSTADETMLMGSCSGNLSATATQNCPLVGANVGNENTAWIVAPAAGTLKNLYMRLETAPGTTATRAFAVMVNSASSAITVTFGSGESAVKSDISHTASIVAGDMISIVSTVPGVSAAASLAEFGVTFSPTSDGDFFIPSMTSSSLSASVVNYLSPSSYNGLNATETLVQQYVPVADWTINGARWKLSVAPANGAGTQAYDTVLDHTTGTPASTTFAMDINEAGTTASASGTFAPAAGDLLATAVTPSMTPATSRPALSYLGRVTPVVRNGNMLLGVFH